MHDTAMEIGCLVMDRYSNLAQAKVLELGSYDVNGSLRSHAPESTEYVGLDLEAGPGVDIVVEPGKPWPVPDNYFDLVLASSVFEHDPMFWVTFLQMIKKVKNGGYIYISAPSNGSVHRYPEDHWRFYPDSGLALMRWAESQGQHVHLVESFTAARKGDQWNDFVALFRKGRTKKNLPKDFVYKNFNSLNVHTWQSSELINPSSKTEDMLIIDDTRSRVDEFDNRLRALSAENQNNWDERQKAERCLLTVEGRLSQEEAAHQASREQVVQLTAAIERQKFNLQDSETKISQYKELIVAYESAKGDLEKRLEQQSHAANQAGAQLAIVDSELKELKARNDALQREVNEQRVAVEELAQVRDRLAVAESTLLQRQEEIEQTRAELIGLRAIYEVLLKERDALAVQVKEADSWVFKLAAERKNWEVQAERATRDLEKIKAETRAEVARLSSRLNQVEDEKRLLNDRASRAESDLASLHGGLSEVQGNLEAAKAQLQSLATDREALVSELERVNRKASERSSEIVRLTRLLDEASLNRSLVHDKDAKLEAVVRERDAFQSELEKSTRQSTERLSEVVTLTRVLEATQCEVDSRQKKVDWLRETNRAMETAPRWWSFLPKKQRRKRQLHRLRRRGLFDRNDYLARYPDVAEAGMDPLEHFIIHGINEGRSI